jgi:hypothetical protein
MPHDFEDERELEATRGDISALAKAVVVSYLQDPNPIGPDSTTTRLIASVGRDIENEMEQYVLSDDAQNDLQWGLSRYALLASGLAEIAVAAIRAAQAAGITIENLDSALATPYLLPEVDEAPS